MSVPEYETWWPLHLRAARGEVLTEAEHMLLEAAYAEQDRQEASDLAAAASANLQHIRQMREQIEALESVISFQRKRRKTLAAQIRRLEAALQPAAREAIGLPRSV